MVGKGGVGKTSISGTLARLLARRGRRVLAIDGDPNPNLALTLGVTPEQMEAMPTLSADLVEFTDGTYRLTKSFEEVCAAHSLAAPDGVTLLALRPEQKAGAG
ncbi:MAG TPA: AAA family ATPase [Solirubrobacteraceae bacterium]|nr:AAA family ATPase [Solirubrobacteraceae bacterium]